jgi:hypothetical protein
MSNWGYQVIRRERARFDDRMSYLQGRAGEVSNPQLCQVMERMVGGLELREKALGDAKLLGQRRVAGGPHANLDPNWVGLPWLTPVLGSGCLELPDDPALTPEALADNVRRHIRAALGSQEDERVAGADPFSERAARFAEELATDRLNLGRGRPRSPRPSGPPTAAERPPAQDEGDTLAARVVLVACLLTQFFYRVKGASSSPLRRWNEDRATLSKGLFSLVDVMQDVVRPSLDQIELVRGALSDKPSLLEKGLDRPVCSVLYDVYRGLERREPSLTFAHLRLVTDMAWYVLTRGTTIYPGWSDLLLGLMLREPRDGGPQSFPRTRPRLLNLHSVPKGVANLYMPPTTRSWNTAFGLQASETTPSDQSSTPSEPLTGRDRLYGRVADVLWAQTRALRATDGQDGPSPRAVPGPMPPTTSPLPPASAFVTSFDIELDMALWLRAIEADTPADRGSSNGHSDEERPLAPFFVVVPVHVLRHAEDEHAALCWLRGQIEPDRNLSLAEQLRQIMRPKKWTLLTPSLDPRELLGGPHVVHLSGCPLFELPKRGDPAVRKLIEALREVHVRIEDPDSICLEHAVTVDEYLAFRQAEVELLWSAHKARSKEDRRSRGLHPFLLASSRSPSDAGQNPRFWTAFGVPVADAGVRHRIVSQFTLRHLLALADEPSGSLMRQAAEAIGGGRLGSPPSREGGRLGTAPSVALMDEGEEALEPDAGMAPQPQDRRLDGVVVNRRINDDEASILYWVGLDVVTDDAESFIPDLEHYARHLTVPPQRPPRTLECPLAGEVRS